MTRPLSRKKYHSLLISGIGDRVRKIRGKLTQVAFAEKIGVSQGAVQKYEKEINLPGEEISQRIAEFGGTTVEWLLRGDKKIPELGGSITIESPTIPSVLHSPFLFGAVDINAMTQIIETVEELLIKRKKPLKPVKKALLLSLLYDNFQNTGQPLDQATLKEFLRRVD